MLKIFEKNMREKRIENTYWKAEFKHPSFKNICDKEMVPWETPTSLNGFAKVISLGGFMFNHILVRDSMGIWTLPLPYAGEEIFAYIVSKDYPMTVKAPRLQYHLQHTSFDFAWIYDDDLGRITKFYADTIEFYHYWGNYVIKIIDKSEI